MIRFTCTFGPRTCVLKTDPDTMQTLLRAAADGFEAQSYNVDDNQKKANYCRNHATALEGEHVRYEQGRGL